jgi:hypothetical protein
MRERLFVSRVLIFSCARPRSWTQFLARMHGQLQRRHPKLSRSIPVLDGIGSRDFLEKPGRCVIVGEARQVRHCRSGRHRRLVLSPSPPFTWCLLTAVLARDALQQAPTSARRKESPTSDPHRLLPHFAPTPLSPFPPPSFHWLLCSARFCFLRTGSGSRRMRNMNAE